MTSWTILLKGHWHYRLPILWPPLQLFVIQFHEFLRIFMPTDGLQMLTFLTVIAYSRVACHRFLDYLPEGVPPSYSLASGTTFCHTVS